MTSRRRRGELVVSLLLVGSCSSDDGDAVDPSAPLESGAPAPDGFAATVAEATAQAGELSVEQRIKDCVDDDDVLRRLRWSTESAVGLVGVTTMTFTPSG